MVLKELRCSNTYGKYGMQYLALLGEILLLTVS